MVFGVARHYYTLSSQKLSAMLNKLKDQLNKDGVIYAFFKHGNAERIDEYGRLFRDMNFERFDRLKVEYKGC